MDTHTRPARDTLNLRLEFGVEFKGCPKSARGDFWWELKGQELRVCVLCLLKRAVLAGDGQRYIVVILE